MHSVTKTITQDTRIIISYQGFLEVATALGTLNFISYI